VEAADHRRLDDLALIEALHRSGLWGVLAQGKVCSGAVVAAFYEFLKPRQEAKGRTRVLLDRRTGASDGAPPTALPIEQRTPIPAAATALLGMLDFMVLHRAGAHWLA
jgi:hypothetical protein